MRLVLAAAAIVGFVLSSSVARAEIQKRGSEQFPGKNEISLHIGGQSGLGNYTLGCGAYNCIGGGPPSGFRFQFDYGYRVNDLRTFSVWLDAGFALTLAGTGVPAAGGVLWGGDEVKPFFGVKLKWKTPIPLVPYARFVGEFAGIFNRYCGDNGFGILAHAAGGAEYFLTRHIGVGLETGISLGPSFYSGESFGCDPYYVYTSHAEFYASFDIEAGAEFVF